MTAQYRPYRDEDGSDEQDQDLNWSDHEPAGSLQIYEKTTYEDIKFLGNPRRTLYVFIITVLFSLLFGFLAGYCIRASTDHDHLHYHEPLTQDDTIKDRLLAKISAARMQQTVEEYSVRPRIPSTLFDEQLVEEIVRFFKRNKLDKIEVKNYSVLLSSPDLKNPNFVEVIETKGVRRTIFSTLNSSDESETHPFSAYSPAGDITGEVVFVNYGEESDYEQLKEWNISLSGKILLAKQLHISAEDQLHLAQDVGAAGLLLYPDPSIEKVPGDAVRRDSLLWNGMGDPQTPGYPSTAYAYRIPVDDLKVLPKIPVQPISMSTALQILVLLSGRRCPNKWLPHSNSSYEYKVGPGFEDPSYKLRLKVTNRLEQKTIHNVIGSIRGRSEPDRYVIIGNHRDSWTTGSIDSAGGSAALLELVQAFAELANEGWRPRRSLMFCSWGAEEYNLIGSTEWLEENIKLVQARAVAYVSSDILVVGNESVSIASSPLLYQVVFNATQRIPYPHLGPSSSFRTIYDKWLATFPSVKNKSQLLFSDSMSHSGPESTLDYEGELELVRSGIEKSIPELKSGSILMNYVNSAATRVRPKIRPLDAKSVYSPFVSLAGVPAVEVTFVPGVTESDTVLAFPLIHTQYDDLRLISKFDRNFKTHASVTQILAEITRDLADSEFLPFNLLDYCQLLKDLVNELQQHLSNDFVTNGISFSHLESAVHNFTAAALKFHALQDKNDAKDPLFVRRINDQLLLIERAFLDNNGLPRNPNKKHLVLSPSEATATTSDQMFPGLLDEFSLLARTEYENSSWSWEIIKAHYSILCHAIQGAADLIEDV